MPSGRDSARGSARDAMFAMPSRAPTAPASNHPDRMDPAAFIAKMRETKAAEAKKKAHDEVAGLQGYNQYSRPKVRRAGEGEQEQEQHYAQHCVMCATLCRGL